MSHFRENCVCNRTLGGWGLLHIKKNGKGKGPENADFPVVIPVAGIWDGGTCAVV